MSEELRKSDMMELMDRPSFRRFLFRAIQNAGIWSATANGSDGRNLYLEGRRSLGLEILSEVDAAMPVQHPGGVPVWTLIQILREETNTPQEKPNGRRDRNLYRDSNDGDDASE